MTTIPNTNGNGPFISLAEPFAGSGSYEQSLLIKCGGMPGNQRRIRGTVSGNALTGLKVTKLMTPGQAHNDYFVDAGLDTPLNMLPWTSKATSGVSLYLTPAGSAFEFLIGVDQLQEISVWVKAGGAGSIIWEVA